MDESNNILSFKQNKFFLLPHEYQFPLATSILYYGLTALLARGLRVMSKIGLSKYRYLFFLITDFITSFQLMAFSLENGQLRKHYGDLAYVITLVCVGLWAIYAIQDGQSNPCSALLDTLAGKSPMRWAILRSFVQTLGAISSYQYAKMFWSLGLTRSHWERVHQVNCSSDLQVATYLGFSVEFFGTLLFCGVNLTNFSQFHRIENFFKCLLGALLTILGKNCLP